MFQPVYPMHQSVLLDRDMVMVAALLLQDIDGPFGVARDECRIGPRTGEQLARQGLGKRAQRSDIARAAQVLSRIEYP